MTAEPEMTKMLPSVDSKISFLPLINYLKEKRSSVSGIRSGFYNYLIEKFEAEPALSEVMEDLHLLQNHQDLLELLSTLLFPVVSKNDRNSFALMAPYQFQSFYCSDCFCQLFMKEHEQRLLLPSGMPADQLKAIQSSMIYEHALEKFYGIKLNDSPELVYPVTDGQTGLKRYYRISCDRRFIDIKLKGELPPIQDCAVCLNTFRILDLDQQLERMPLDLFRIEGFAVWIAEDVTSAESLEAIKKILIRHNECDTNTLVELKAAVHALAGLQNISVGLMPFVKVNDQYVLEEDCMGQSIIGKRWCPANSTSVNEFNHFTELLMARPEPLPLTHLDDAMLQNIPLLKNVLDEGYRSYIIYPMQNSDGLLGILELASPIPDLLTHEVIARLEPAIPLLSVAMLKGRNTFQNKIEKLIKEKFTALQGPVEWKFVEVAWNQLKNNNAGNATVLFEGVYPLYGAIDVRNSSLERSRAIQKDLKEHLHFIDNVLDQLLTSIPLALLEGLKFKCQTILESIQQVMLAEDEVRIHEFIEDELEPVFHHLQKNNTQAKDIVDLYFKMVDDSNSQLYHYRREYEATLATINEVVLEYLSQEEEAIQRSYPHYFERYRTDGVEYNIYIGQSIAPNNPFDLLYLKNIRLWQLRSMAEVARITNQLLQQIKVPLQTTQLILIHSQCISISFRRDERRFDVEGSYNIRYEVIKKRLDKALIKDTQERLTQPGKIAMVYSNQKEVQEYQQYIEFLQNKNILKRGIEMLELEELQGVKGLKAMRVEINLDPTSTKK